MTAGPEEPNAFVEISEPWFDPIVAATMVELVDGLVAAPRAGVGRLPATGVAPAAAERRHVHVETLVIGGGPSGREAASSAARAQTGSTGTPLNAAGASAMPVSPNVPPPRLRYMVIPEPVITMSA